MTGSDAPAMKARLRTDLVTAQKARQADVVKVLRGLIAALDNAEAPPARPDPAAESRAFIDGSAEVARLALDAAQVRSVLGREADERDQAAAEMDRVAQTDRAQALRAEAALIRRYLA